MVLSEYGTRYAVARNADGSARARDRRHSGVDIKAYNIGEDVIASAAGIVVDVEFTGLGGFSITVSHAPYRRWTRYVHLQKAIVKLGQRVARGDVIGEVGLFPYSGGVVHVHWMLCTNRSCSGVGDLGGTADPMGLAVGCYRSEKQYPSDHLVLTFPVRCD